MEKKEKIIYKILSSAWNYDELHDDEVILKDSVRKKIEQFYAFFERHFSEDLKTVADNWDKSDRVLTRLDSFVPKGENNHVVNLGLLYAKLKSAHQDLLSLEKGTVYNLTFAPVELRLKVLLTKPLFKQVLDCPPPIIEEVDRNCYY